MATDERRCGGFQLRPVRGYGHPVAGATACLVSLNPPDPGLIPGTHELRVEDNQDYTARHQPNRSPEPTIMVGPDIAGPAGLHHHYWCELARGQPGQHAEPTDGQLRRRLRSRTTTCNGRSYPLYADSCGPDLGGTPRPSQCPHPQHRAGEGGLCFEAGW